MLDRKLIREFAAVDAKCRVDRAAGIIYNAKVLGLRSKNGRSYKRNGLKASTYEGCNVNANHAAGGNSSVYDRQGWIENVRITDDGVRADYYALEMDDPFTKKFFAAAERNQRLFGFSHNAYCTQSKDGSTIESVDEVVSVDIVCEPATVDGIFESINRDGRTPTTEARQAAACLRSRARENEPGRPISADELGEELDPSDVSVFMDAANAIANVLDRLAAGAMPTPANISSLRGTRDILLRVAQLLAPEQAKEARRLADVALKIIHGEEVNRFDVMTSRRRREFFTSDDENVDDGDGMTRAEFLSLVTSDE